MARSEARLAVTIWSDPDFLALAASPQRMFMFLLSQPDLAHDGVIALRERRWSKAAAGLTVAQVKADLAALDAARFIVLDEDAEELLIRSFIRRDKVYRQPNVLRAAADHLPTVSSPVVLAALAVELRRIAAAEDLKPDAAGIVAEMLEAIGNPSPNPSPKGSGKPSEAPGEATAEPLPDEPAARAESGAGHTASETGHSGVVAGGNPSGNPSPNPSAGTPGERGEGTYVSESPFPDLLAPDPRTPEPAPLRGGELVAPQNAQQILAGWIDHCRANGVELNKRIKGRYAKAIKDALDEGMPPDRVKHALGAMLTECVVDTPAQLPRYLVRVQIGPARWPRRLTPGEQSVVDLVHQDAEVIDLASRFFDRDTA
jgi:hypothetical protein